MDELLRVEHSVSLNQRVAAVAIGAANRDTKRNAKSNAKCDRHVRFRGFTRWPVHW